MTSSKTVTYDHGQRIAERAKQNNPWNEPLAPSVARSKPAATPSAETIEPMREASILLPTRNNDGMAVISAHAIVANALLDNFGGFTEESVRGQWLDNGRVYSDESIRYTVAATDTPDNRAKLEATARQACADAEQICLYVRGFDGIVQFVKP